MLHLVIKYWVKMKLNNIIELVDNFVILNIFSI